MMEAFKKNLYRQKLIDAIIILYWEVSKYKLCTLETFLIYIQYTYLYSIAYIFSSVNEKNKLVSYN